MIIFKARVTESQLFLISYRMTKIQLYSKFGVGCIISLFLRILNSGGPTVLTKESKRSFPFYVCNGFRIRIHGHLTPVTYSDHIPHGHLPHGNIFPWIITPIIQYKIEVGSRTLNPRTLTPDHIHPVIYPMGTLTLTLNLPFTLTLTLTLTQETGVNIQGVTALLPIKLQLNIMSNST